MALSITYTLNHGPHIPIVTILKTTAHCAGGRSDIFWHISCILMSCLYCEVRNLAFASVVYHEFSLRILHTVKCQIFETLAKYLRKIFLADDPWMTHFDSEGSAFYFVCFPKSVIPCARVRKLLFQVK